ncbi:MAG: tetratricopeptide repeat protein [Lactobacillus sp.]|nr:tetratricopeptide repeat protein [Lactobacillus sp.]
MTNSEKLIDAITSHDFSSNQELLRKALESDSEADLAALAEQLTELGFTDLSRKVYEHLIKLSSANHDQYQVYLAEIMLNDGEDDQALEILYAISETSDAYVDSLLVLADYYQMSGLIEPAMVKLETANRIKPHTAAIIFGLAELNYLAGNFQNARKYYEELLTEQSYFGEVDLELRLFDCLAKMGEYEDAAKIVKEHEGSFLDIDSRYRAALIFIQTGKYQEAVDYLEKIIEAQPDYVSAYPLLVDAYLKLNKDKDALKVAQLGLSYNDYDELLYADGAQAAIHLGETKEAQELLEEGLKVNPDNQQMLVQLSDLNLKNHAYKENLDLLLPLEESERSPIVHWNLGASYNGLDQFEDAKSEYLAAWDALNDNPDYLKELLLLFINLGEKPELIKQIIAKYQAIVPNDPEVEEILENL